MLSVKKGNKVGGFIIILFLLFVTNTTFAQIGYQVSLLNSATGQPRAGETVTVDIKLTNCENATVYTTQQKATSNDFGVLSLSVGDAKTFDELDWNKLPLYIEVSIDGVLIAKSQVLSVPVAEYAKKSGFVLTKEFLASKKWTLYAGGKGTVEFDISGSVTVNITDSSAEIIDEITSKYSLVGTSYYILGDMVVLNRLKGYYQIPEEEFSTEVFAERIYLMFDSHDSSFIQLYSELKFADYGS